MSKDYLITVTGTQTFDEESETLELTTSAVYGERNGKKLIKYKEYDTEDAGSVVSNIIKIEGKDKITLVKNNGVHYSQLILEYGKRHQCFYSTPIGNMAVGIYTDSMTHEIDENGGRIEIDYSIDFNGDFQSENHLVIVLCKKELS